MNKERNYKNAVIFVLLLSVIVLSVAFAAFSTNLQVSGTTKVLSSTNSWNIAFESASATKGGYATSTASDVTGGKTTTIQFDCEIASDADSCTLKGTIKNYGKINAKYTGYELKLGENTQTAQTEVSNDDVKVIYTKPLNWAENTTVLDTDDSGEFTLEIKAQPGIVFPEGEETPAKEYTVSLTFKFEQAEPTE